MSTIPWKVGATITEKILLVDHVTKVGTTGKVNGDWTKRITHLTTGNVSTTGLTVTEVDAVNDPGHYAVTILGSTGFQATTTGEYLLEIFLTADETYKFAMTILVTSNGDFSGTWGAASFTAVASNGRVTDGASAIAGATVRILDSSGRIYDQLTTDISGLWGPTFFVSDGTYLISASKSGYSTVSASTITVTGGVATGPGTDVALTSVTSTSGLLASDLWAYARRMARNRVGTQADTEVKQAVNDALDMVSQECEWPWLLYGHGVLSLDAFYILGTIALTNGLTTVTLTGGTWPTWAASGKLKVNGKVYFISSRTSGSVIEMANPWKEATSATASYVIFHDEYTLASDLQKFGQLFPGMGWSWGGDPIGYDELLRNQNDSNFSLKYPVGWAIAANKIIFWPYPSADVLINYSYYKKPAALVSSTDAADWDPNHLVLLRRAIDYQVSIRYEDSVPGNPTTCMQIYKEQLARAKPNSRNPMGLPPLGGRSGRRYDPSQVVLP